jgi:ATP/maltotriose-dependent transcriptional regulator MalT
MLNVNISKVTPPSLPPILHRSRLLDLLEKNKDKKLILILGQAAQGKTTLAASYVKTSKSPSAWVTLGEEDSDPYTLFHTILQSLQQVLKDVDFSHIRPHPPGKMQTNPGVHLFRDWTQSLFGLISSPIQIVLDGLDQLFPLSPAFKFLQILVENAPLNIHLIMLSRETPPPSLKFQRLKIKQEAFILTNEELAFSQDEIREFFKQIRKINLNADQLKRISAATEGWIGGLILLSESWNRFPEDSGQKSISEDLPDHFKGEVFQYFAREIFSGQPEQIQQFLLQTSIFDLLEPGFMKDFSAAENSEEILQGLARRNLFVRAIYDDQKGWLYRSHQLFRNFLRVKFESEIGDGERQSLFFRAGSLYEQRGELENALKYYLQGKAYPHVASVIERLGMKLLQSGRRDDLSAYLLSLAKKIIQGNPWLLFYQTMTRQFQGGEENAVLLKKAYALFKRKGDKQGELIALAQLIQASIYTGIHIVPLKRLVEEGEAILSSSETDEYPYARAMLGCGLGLGHILGDGDIRKGISACQNAYLISKHLKDSSLQANALNFSGLGYNLVGEFSLANEACKKAEKAVEKGVYPELRAVNLMVGCRLANGQGDFARAQVLFEELQREIDKYGFVFISPWIYEISAYLKLSRGEYLEAEETGQQYLELSTTLKSIFFRALALRLLGLVYLHRGDFRKARKVTEQSLETLTLETRSEYVLQNVKVLLGLILYHLRDYQAAEEKLAEALNYFNRISSHIGMAETHLVIALLKWEQGKKDQAAAHLQTGFKIAEKKKYDYFLFPGTKYLARACLLALELKVGGAMDYAGHLLSTRLSSMAEDGVKKLRHHRDSKIQETARAIRRRIHRSRVPLLRIETLGGFRVFRGDSPMEEKDWDRNQPRKLLKAILSHGEEKIPKEILMDDLWPEEGPDAADKKFKTTLRRLRKSLESPIDKDFSSSYIHLHDNFVFLDRELCQVDVDLFLSLLKKGEEKERKDDGKSALSFYAEALEIYKGDFLPEELYEPWVDVKREELKGEYIEVLKKVAKIYDRQGAATKAINCYQRVIQADPLLEESYQVLMNLYANRGMLNEALRTYEACKRAFEAGLKTKPDPTTTALYKKILERIHSA